MRSAREIYPADGVLEAQRGPSVNAEPNPPRLTQRLVAQGRIPVAAVTRITMGQRPHERPVQQARRTVIVTQAPTRRDRVCDLGPDPQSQSQSLVHDWFAIVFEGDTAVRDESFDELRTRAALKSKSLVNSGAAIDSQSLQTATQACERARQPTVAERLHHNVHGCERTDSESLLKGASFHYNSIEEAEFRILRNQRRMVQHAYDRRMDAKLVCADVLSLHKIFFEGFDWAGRWRVHGEDVVVGRKNWKTPPCEKVADAMECWTSSYNSSNVSIDSVFHQMAQLYYEFCDIHPFRDGNGRMARLLVELYAVKHGMTGQIDPTHVRRFRNRNDRAFERARGSNGKQLGSLRKLLERCWQDLP
ncbi:MAG: Fic family protein [bacterium]